MGKIRHSLLVRRSLPILLFVLILCSYARAQVVTNKALLQQASQQMAQKENTLNQRLLLLSRQKGWPSKITGRRGRIAVLHGLDDNGRPLYIATCDNIISAATIGTSQLWPGGSTGLNLNG